MQLGLRLVLGFNFNNRLNMNHNEELFLKTMEETYNNLSNLKAHYQLDYYSKELYEKFTNGHEAKWGDENPIDVTFTALEDGRYKVQPKSSPIFGIYEISTQIVPLQKYCLNNLHFTCRLMNENEIPSDSIKQFEEYTLMVLSFFQRIIIFSNYARLMDKSLRELAASITYKTFEYLERTRK